MPHTATERRPRMTEDERRALNELVIRRYEANKPIRDIASEVGRSYGMVHGILRRAGVPFRKRGGPMGNTKRASSVHFPVAA